MKTAVSVLVVGALASISPAQSTELVSAGMGGAPANGQSSASGLSRDGRRVVFESFASNLVPGDVNDRSDIFVRDRLTGSTVLASVDEAGGPLGTINARPAISGNGNTVAFESWYQPFPPMQIWYSRLRVRDLASSGSTVIAEGYDTVGLPFPQLSEHGRWVTYTKAFSYQNGTQQIWIHDRQAGTATLVSADAGGGPANSDCGFASLSSDGRFVAFFSLATDLVPGDGNNASDVFVRDLGTGSTALVSRDSTGAQGNSASRLPSISADGRFVAFESTATNLVPGDTNGLSDVFVHDRLLGTTIRITDGPRGDLNWPRISGDGRFVVYHATAGDIVPGDTNGVADVFVHDLGSGTTVRASVGAVVQGNGLSEYAWISGDGSEVVFASRATNLDPADTMPGFDVFLRAFAPACVSPVPYCTAVANSTGAPASIGSTGWASLSANNFVLICSGLPPSPNGMFFHGTTAVDPGIPFGNGVRCVAGTLQRLGIVGAQNGYVQQAQDLSSAAYAGVAVGSTRHFAFWFRDVAAGGAGFNASNGLTVLFCP